MSVERVVWPWDKRSRDEWKDVIQATKDTWANCYYDQGEALTIGELVEALSLESDLHDLYDDAA